MNRADQYPSLSRDNAICLLVDQQCCLISLVQAFSPPDFKNNVLALANSAKTFQLPTILTTNPEQGPGGPLLPELLELFPQAPCIAHPGTVNPWNSEPLVDAVRRTGRKQLIIAGAITEVCVAFPVLSAIASGYQVFVVTDASGTFDEISCHAACVYMATAGARLTSQVGVDGDLRRDAGNAA